MLIAPLLILNHDTPLLPHLAAKWDALVNADGDQKRPCAEQPIVTIDRRDNVCEQELATALREVARMRSLYLEAARCCQVKVPCAETNCAPAETSPASSRNPYAAPALGDLTHPAAPAPPAEPAAILHKRIVSNTGSLIDLVF